jgi:broad specificity phosphatase PhoE
MLVDRRSNRTTSYRVEPGEQVEHEVTVVIRLYLLAHAPTAAQRHFRFPADEGVEPVDPAVADRVLAKIGRCGVVWRGPERRAEETAAMFRLDAMACQDLRAWSAGAWAGQAVASVAERDPAGFAAWRTDPDATPNGGESLRGLIERATGWLEAQVSDAGRILVIADPTVIRAAIMSVLDAPPSTFWRLDVPPLSLSIVQHANGEWRLRGLNVDVD